MSSDYIPRLRSELLRAGASRQPRWRRAPRQLKPVAVALAVALVAVALVLVVPGEHSDDAPAGTVQLSYRVQPVAAEQAAQIVRDRLAAAGIGEAEVFPSAQGITVAVPDGAKADAAALLQPGRFAIYDWEASVLGPKGKTAPLDPAVTGDPDTGHAAAVTLEEAKARAEGRPGARVVRGLGEGWFALAGAPAITNAQVTEARAAVDPSTQEPILLVSLDRAGQNAFRELTRAQARRGADNAGPGADRLAALQHFAIVIDDRIVSIPYIDFTDSPDGLNSSGGVRIMGGLTPKTARRLAAVLSAGPLP
jgi:preprotein translocase subunit SecD